MHIYKTKIMLKFIMSICMYMHIHTKLEKIIYICIFSFIIRIIILYIYVIKIQYERLATSTTIIMMNMPYYSIAHPVWLVRI